MGRRVRSDEDCADCLCRVCARNADNDSYNSKLKGDYKYCSCSACSVFHEIVETEEDCQEFLPDEDM